MQRLEILVNYCPHVAGILTLFAATLAAGHVILHKRDSRAAVLWVGFIFLVPALGPVLYLMFGINRVRRRAVSLRKSSRRPAVSSQQPDWLEASSLPLPPPDLVHLEPLALALERIVGRSLVAGNQVKPLLNGDEAYPEMLSAIVQAKHSISLSTYIFDNDRSGKVFASALGDAVRRGVQVLVLIDDVGSRYSWPSIIPILRHAHVRVACFLPTFAPWRLMTMNLRDHRKILVVDGQVGFTGGMNLREGNLLKEHPRQPVQDLHFRVEGPIVAQLQEVFANDWAFVTKERLSGTTWFPPLEPKGNVIARIIPDGPDEDFEKLHWTILSALACARKSVQIITPYFLPDIPIISAINLALVRGVEVDLLLPLKSNLPYVQWASRAMWWQVLRQGCRIWLTRPPFDHSKLMIVDGLWALIGSGNWDARSLRLNFELNLECYERRLACELEAVVAAKLIGARRVTLKEVDSRSLPVKLWDGTARLLTPYL